jgi:hypothetical protein
MRHTSICMIFKLIDKRVVTYNKNSKVSLNLGLLVKGLLLLAGPLA